MAGLRTLTIDGTSLLSAYGVWINGNNVFNGAEPNVETVVVPGRNGDLVYSNKRYNNFSLQYPCMIPKNLKTNLPDLRAFLYQTVGYRKIQDSYFPSMYRLGRITGNMNPSQIAWAQNGGLFDLTFDCKPQHFYNSGLAETTYTADATITNDTLFEALPLLRVYGSGRLFLNGVNLSINSHNYAYTDLDCELQDAFYGSVNLNEYVSILNGDAFPTLSPGDNELSLGSGITQVIITPRWWTL